MDLKRVLTTVLGLPIVALLFVLGNEYVIGVAVLIVSIISMYEYFGAVKKGCKTNTMGRLFIKPLYCWSNVLRNRKIITFCSTFNTSCNVIIIFKCNTYRYENNL